MYVGDSEQDDSSERPELLFGYEDFCIAPWATRFYKLSFNGLHSELVDLYHWMRPTEVERQVRLVVFRRLERTITSFWPQLSDLQIKCFGSLSTNLFLPTSDIDIVVEFDESAEFSTENVLERTTELLCNCADVKDVRSVRFTPVPVIKLIDVDTSINIDIAFNTRQGMRAAIYIEEAKQLFPVLEPLVFFLKQYLIKNNLHVVYSGGLSSYALVLMLLHFLKVQFSHLENVHYLDKRVNLGVLLLRFLEVYALEFNYFDVAIHVRKLRYVVKPPHELGQPKLCIYDPLCEGEENDVGKSSYNIMCVRAAFERALVALRGVFLGENPSHPGIKERYDGSMLHSLLRFTQAEVRYRMFLRGYAIWNKCPQTTPERRIDHALFLAPPYDKDLCNEINSTIKEAQRSHLYQNLNFMQSSPSPSSPGSVLETIPNSTECSTGTSTEMSTEGSTGGSVEANNGIMPDSVEAVPDEESPSSETVNATCEITRAPSSDSGCALEAPKVEVQKTSPTDSVKSNRRKKNNPRRWKKRK